MREMAFSFKLFATLGATVSNLQVSASFQVPIQVASPLVLNATLDTLVLPHVGVDFGVGDQAVLRGEGFITLLTSKLGRFLFSVQHFRTLICFSFDIILFHNCGNFLVALRVCDIALFLNCGHFMTGLMVCDIILFLHYGHFMTAFMDLDHGCICFNSILFYDLFRSSIMRPFQVVYEKYLLIEYFATLLTFVSHQVTLSLLVAHQVTPILELHPTLLTLILPIIRMYLPVLPEAGP